MLLSTLGRRIAAAMLVLVVASMTLAGAVAQELNFERDERFRGLVKPDRQVTLGSPVDGILASLRVDEHEVVEEGQLVVQMDDVVQRVAVAAAKLRAEDETEIRRQRLLLEEADIQLERIVELEEKDAAREYEVRRMRLQRDATEAALERAQHEREVAQRSYEVERERLDRLKIKAPFDGMVIRIQGESGASLRLGDGILQLMALDTLEAQLFLPVELYGELEVGREYKLEAETPVNRTITARLKSVEPVIDSASNTFRVLFAIDNKDLELPVGFTVRLIWPQEAAGAAATAE